MKGHEFCKQFLRISSLLATLFFISRYLEISKNIFQFLSNSYIQLKIKQTINVSKIPKIRATKVIIPFFLFLFLRLFFKIILIVTLLLFTA